MGSCLTVTDSDARPGRSHTACGIRLSVICHRGGWGSEAYLVRGDMRQGYRIVCVLSHSKTCSHGVGRKDGRSTLASAPHPCLEADIVYRVKSATFFLGAD